jgi:hypothetical protein
MYTIVIRRPDDHHKGPKEIARIPYGEPVPPGLIIGKGALITIEGPVDNAAKVAIDGITEHLRSKLLK